MELRRHALELLLQADPASKAAQTRTWSGRDAGQYEVDEQAQLAEPAGVPGRPERPRRVAPQALAARNAFTRDGRAALLHAVAHIEFNAINLALDAVWRFAGLPRAYYLEWMQVAAEEALHFTLVSEHLATLDCAYGDFDAHDGLWTMAERTRDDPLARMALVPRTLEARGLDVTPAMREKFVRAGDPAAARILDVIMRDEIGHVALGNRWYRWLCARDARDPITSYDELAARYRAPRLKPPFNLEARRAAGFDAAELAALQARERAHGAAH